MIYHVYSLIYRRYIEAKNMLQNPNTLIEKNVWSKDEKLIHLSLERIEIVISPKNINEMETQQEKGKHKNIFYRLPCLALFKL